jgi:hypothetical protein
MMWITGKFGGTFSFSNCHICIIELDMGGLVFHVSGFVGGAE